MACFLSSHFSLDWNILPKEEEDEYLYTVQVKRHPSPSKQPVSSLKTTIRSTEETSLRPPCTPPEKGVIEVTSSEDINESTDNSKGQKTESSTESFSQFAKGR